MVKKIKSPWDRTNPQQEPIPLWIVTKASRSGTKFTKLLSCLQAKNIANKTEKWLMKNMLLTFGNKHLLSINVSNFSC